MVDTPGSWIQRLLDVVVGRTEVGPSSAPPASPPPTSAPPTSASLAAQPLAAATPIDGPASAREPVHLSEVIFRGLDATLREDWRDLLRAGRRVQATWGVAGATSEEEQLADGWVRTMVDDRVWIWLNCDVPSGRRPVIGQAVQVLAPRADALRLIPCRVVEEGHGGSLLLTVSGRVLRIQRRENVRATVALPRASAIRLRPDGRPIGLLGAELLDVSAGGARFNCQAQLSVVERIRLVLNLDDGPPITPTLTIVDMLLDPRAPGTTVRGRFTDLEEPDRQRIVQFVYRQEIAARRETTLAD
ncbi:MAG: PilZ domain-containing protein [Chloroflexi bacterium]|nr:PilZ domain-containing protein [Chloroflexota bacterium]